VLFHSNSKKEDRGEIDDVMLFLTGDGLSNRDQYLFRRLAFIFLLHIFFLPHLKDNRGFSWQGVE
jgi:hypothetical protein